ncbi:secreted frizzled-related protein 5-like isoform X3 [Bacillus rossius redtenbacheri]|uniref:secreted frizzled-related protein 5-like isoform X3 n=1 Tax=Bacillus rossius redtenbacheri TaxID=93214 RepID=UPI002FDE0E22
MASVTAALQPLLLLATARASSGLWGSRTSQPACVDIPRNVSLCHGVGYRRMRLPNLLEHDSLQEVAQQAASWTPLLNVDCHPDTRLFLCSLFSPVCLDRAIYPCRSLCDQVRRGCEGIMQKFGYPWPDMFRCDHFPVDNDMCIGPQAKRPDNECQVCSPIETYENILYNFCSADFVVPEAMQPDSGSRTAICLPCANNERVCKPINLLLMTGML